MEEISAYLKEMQIILTAGLVTESEKMALTLEQFIARLKARGTSIDEIRAILFRDLEEGGPIFGDFRKHFKSGVKYGIEEAAQTELFQAFQDAELWDWVGIADGRLCPDCLVRHNTPSKPRSYWESIGLPRQGSTICQENCRCDLIPVGLIDKREIPDGINRSKK